MDGTRDNPWNLTTPPGTSTFTVYRDPEAGRLVCQVGTTRLEYQLRCIEVRHA